MNKSSFPFIPAGMEGNEPNPQERIMEKREQLLQLGYVWQNDPAGHDYEPGIPSLMSYVREYTLAQNRGKAVSKAETTVAPSVDDRGNRPRKDRPKGRSIGLEI